MKKIIAILIGLLSVSAYADECKFVDWKPWIVRRAMNTLDNHDYVWKNAREFNDAKVNDARADVAICGGIRSGICHHGDTLIAPKEHVFKGEVIHSEQGYVCIAGLTNDPHWEPVNKRNSCATFRFEGANVTLQRGERYPMQNDVTMTKEECSKITGEKLSGLSFQIECDNDLKLHCIPKTNPNNQCTAIIKEKSVTVAQGKEYNVDLSAAECQTAAPLAITSDLNAVYHFFCGPGCKKVGCKSGYENDNNGKCVKQGSQKSCREQRAGMGPEAIACCDTGNAATWDTPQKGKCNCKDTNTHFEIVNGRGQCVANNNTIILPNPVILPDDPKPTKECPSDAYPEDGTCVCKYDNMEYNGKTCECTAVPNTHKEGNKCVCDDPGKEIKNNKCTESDELVNIKIRITELYGNLGSTMGGFERSVWKDAEGNFNTARLASDSIAGVVLGTAGGLITANVVKKNQLKQGFEDVKCSVGGQNIASYGDDFSVGLQ